MNNIKNTFRAGFVLAAGVVALYSCTDTWNDHYDAEAVLKYDGTTMQAIEENASDFAKVIKAYGYERELSSDNTYTVWAPANGSFDVNDYLKDGKAIADSAETVKWFIKNHVARYAHSFNSTDQKISLMNEKVAQMTADGKFGLVNITKSNISCKNGVLHLIESAAPYNYNLFELISKQYHDDATDGKDTIPSLYRFLYDPTVNKDSLIEEKSVSRGVDENGDKIWVDSFVLRNNTVLKQVDAKIYEEDSSYIAILPSVKAWSERYELAKNLLVFNPSEDAAVEGTCDSLQRHYANRFAMTDLFYNKNANEHWKDSLKSTNYEKRTWYENVYYSKEPYNMPEDKEINDILSKCGDAFACSNGEAYMVDEYPMSYYEQFFKRIKVKGNNDAVDMTIDSKGDYLFLKNTSVKPDGSIKQFRTPNGSIRFITTDENDDIIEETTKEYSYIDIEPATTSSNPQVGFKIKNTLSGTYDMFLVMCPIWLNNISADELDARGYRFYVNVYERANEGKTIGEYPTSGVRLQNPLSGDNYFTTEGLRMDTDGHMAVTDTLYLGEYTFKNAYYGRNNEGVILQLQSQITTRLNSQYSREMLVSSIILKPHDDNHPVVIVKPEDAEPAEAIMRKAKQVKIINKEN
ncbi:MAG: fasciclin domain-containing protein [Prevotella sp.]|nr:fasciclin domain-containing protein [Candidatus Prevotella equi]